MRDDNRKLIREVVVLSVLVILCLVGAWVAYHAEITPGSPITAKTPMPTPPTDTAVAAVDSSPVPTVAPDLSNPAALRVRSMRLVPDRRFTTALERIYRFYKPGSDAKARVEYVDGGWVVALGESSEIHWPEPVDFADYAAAAEALMAALDGDRGATRDVPISEGELDAAKRAIEAGHPAGMIRAIETADRLWTEGKNDARLLPLVAEAATRLAYEQDDVLRNGDDLDSYALYATSLERHFIPSNDTVRREARIASHLHYGRYARELAAQLDDADPLRRLIVGDFGGYQRLLPYDGASYFEQFQLERKRIGIHGGDENRLFSKALAERPFDQCIYSKLTGMDWWGTVRMLPGTQSALSGLALTALTESSREGDAYFSLLDAEKIDESAYESKARSVKAISEEFADPFDAGLWELLHRFETRAPGPLADHAALGRYFRNFLLGAIHREAEHYGQTLGSVEAMDEFLKRIPDGVDRELDDYRAWYRAWTDGTRGKPVASAYLDLVTAQSDLPAHCAKESFEEYGDYVPSLSNEMQKAFQSLHDRADGRPRWRSDFSWYGLYFSLDPFRGIDELSALSMTAPDEYPERMALYGLLTRDAGIVREAAKNPAIRESSRVTVLRQLAKIEGTSHSIMAEKFLEEYRTSEGSRVFLDAAWDEFRADDNLQRIAETGSEWLATVDGESDVGIANTRADVAAAYSLLGDHEEAWRIIEPGVPVYNESSLTWGSRIRDRLGDADGALKLAEASFERYPYSMSARMSLVEWHWRRNDYDAAAAALMASGARVESWTWKGYFPLRIRRIFEERPREDLQSATLSLLRAGLPLWSLLSSARDLNDTGYDDLAWAIASQVGTIVNDEPTVAVEIYGYIKRAQGADAARDWWKSTASARVRKYGDVFLYQDGFYDELWTLFPEALRAAEPYHALLQAAAVAQDSAIAAAYGEDTRSFLASAGDDWYYALGRFLLGDETEDVIEEHMKRPKRLCEGAYFLGALAEAEGRVSDAMQWYLVCTDTGLRNNGEFTLAGDRLRAFKNREVSLEIAELQWKEEHASGV